MTALELLAPARNKDIGIAAIQSGADAVYIAGPEFGARKDAGNSIEDIAELCGYAHLFGARIFVTVNTTIREDELQRAHELMLRAQEAGADAFIIRDERLAGWDDIIVPLHASTQCAIRDVRTARHFESLGCGRIVLERELALQTVREICRAVKCEVEFFVHGAICVCYNGECRLSESICGRSADRGECIQACRSLYDLADASGKVLMKNKALLSLKDYKLKERLLDLADAGVCSFKIEGRLKNASYVKNVVREYSLALDRIVEGHPGQYCRASFGKVSGGFVPDSDKTFNRGYTELYLDGERGKEWSSMTAPKSMGEEVGRIVRILERDGRNCEITVRPVREDICFSNGDGFAAATGSGVVGFRGDVCSGRTIICKKTAGIKEGATLYRNYDAAFEKGLESSSCRRELDVDVHLDVMDGFRIKASATSEDGREAFTVLDAGTEPARNRDRMAAMLDAQLSKGSGHFRFRLAGMDVHTKGDELPLVSASALNEVRRNLAGILDGIPCHRRPLHSGYKGETVRRSPTGPESELMRSKYCIRYELGMCPVHQGAQDSGPLFLLNNGQKFALGFDCHNCEMTVTRAQN